MQYRDMGSLNIKVSALGFGAMRLPIIDDDSANIDKKRAAQMIRYSIDKGVNYIDTAWPYHQGESEKLVAEVLKDGYRDKVYLATKLPIWEVETKADLDKYLNQQLEKLEVDYIDFYLLHALNQQRWEKVKELEILEWLEEKVEAGKINYIGFSFHDSYQVFSEILNAYQWDFCQIQYNYLDTEYQAGKKGLKEAYEKDIAVIVMEPLRGGWLAQKPPQNVKDLFKEKNKEWNAVEWSLHWLWSQKEVALVLSGMSNFEQVKENIQIAEESEIGLLNESDFEMMAKAAEKMRGPISCTRCEYCLPCPEGINIPRIFYLYNKAILLDEAEKMAEKYYKLDEETRADNCIECQQCEPACPQNLEIIELLKKTEKFFAEYR
ncbi:aldo/keto reductase [Halanaerobium hydrogeniformans]|uniref:Aldo/keto reductase n=1 Tax=Halanaerobium hydrogeniformans TaxID=656519 RepID=E4RM87_HALHG|nr:aldo/keto reductase [Halanaerobium hydrogeniformans]ADQ14418.1 aldo/keto reductase [Halanaerobium hydrogeniformans]